MKRLSKSVDLSDYHLLSDSMSRDPEVQPGLLEFCKHFNVSRLLNVARHAEDGTSNGITQQIAEDLRQGKDIAFGQFINRLADRALSGRIWLIFAYKWDAGQEIVFYSGDAETLSQYIRLNQGAYRLTYLTSAERMNVDLDVPLVWELVS